MMLLFRFSPRLWRGFVSFCFFCFVLLLFSESSPSLVLECRPPPAPEKICNPIEQLQALQPLSRCHFEILLFSIQGFSFSIQQIIPKKKQFPLFCVPPLGRGPLPNPGGETLKRAKRNKIKRAAFFSRPLGPDRK